MDKTPLISVVILCYNQEDTIARTIDSVLLQQTDYSFEIIIGEDASANDNTRSICEAYAEKYPNIIRLMAKAPNKGVLKNYSDCLAVCSGKYISTCAGDDWWHNSSKLQLQVEFLENNENYGLVFTNYRIVKFDPVSGNEIFSNSNIISNPEVDAYKRLIVCNFISAGTVLFRNDIFKKHIDFEKFKSLGFFMEDYPMWLEMIQHTKFKYISTETITYTVVEGSLSNNKTDFRKTEEFENSVLDIKKYYIKKYPIKTIDTKILLELHHHFLTSIFIRDGHFERAKYHSKFLINAGIKGFVKVVICHTPIIKLYARYLNVGKNE
jgi:glycosyltransferase involved in cell wall biosynthesis